MIREFDSNLFQTQKLIKSKFPHFKNILIKFTRYQIQYFQKNNVIKYHELSELIMNWTWTSLEIFLYLLMFTNLRKCQCSYMLVKIPSGEHLVAFAVCNPINTFIQKKKKYIMTWNYICQRIGWEVILVSLSQSLRLVYPALHIPPSATITSRSAVRIRINFWRMVGEIEPMHLVSVEGLRPWDWSCPVLQYLREWLTPTVIIFDMAMSLSPKSIRHIFVSGCLYWL